MNREILFKAKRIDNGEWVEGQYVYITNPLTEDGKPIKHLICNGTNIFNDLIDPDTLRQYTGLTDKNGKKIWENDILCGHLDEKYPEDITYTKVFWNVNGFYTKESCSIDVHLLDRFEQEYFEVVGNIFDNPELLEVE